MKTHSIYIFILSFFIFGCNKSQRVVNELDGEWEIVTYRQTYTSGLTSEIESEGTVFFSGFHQKKEQNGVFQCNQYTTINGSVFHLYENGTYYANKRGDHLFVTITNPDGSYQSQRDCSINILTKTDLKFQVVFNDVFHTYVLKKK